MHCFTDDSGRVRIVKGRENWKKYQTSSFQVRIPLELQPIVDSLKNFRAALYAYKKKPYQQQKELLAASLSLLADLFDQQILEGMYCFSNGEIKDMNVFLEAIKNEKN